MNNYWITESKSDKFYIKFALDVQSRLWHILKNYGHLARVKDICFNGLRHNYNSYMKIDQTNYTAGLWLIFLDLRNLKDFKLNLKILRPAIKTLFNYILEHVQFFEFEKIMKRVMSDGLDSTTEYLIRRMFQKSEEKTKDSFKNIINDMEEII